MVKGTKKEIYKFLKNIFKKGCGREMWKEGEASIEAAKKLQLKEAATQGVVVAASFTVVIFLYSKREILIATPVQKVFVFDCIYLVTLVTTSRQESYS